MTTKSKTETLFVNLGHLTYKQAKILRNLVDQASSNRDYDQGEMASLYLELDYAIERCEEDNDLNRGE
ncbi:hypothetical protein PP935_gp140 [Rhizobium phage RHph_N34]|uniref:Uncharacterized protein n=1 Tax=Rhizobium phage RHph_N34 TaxID=2509586 RepID=A0A7S5RFH9_9CAUD|nr:hypothetical protein PP935_gp140 [Rhizobium phage RHph_N34]QIG73915.1 hypothetical protein EVC06_140 [Rhizobium phage RHph_N34]